MSAPATPKNKLKSKPTAKQTVEAYPSVSERLGENLGLFDVQ